MVQVKQALQSMLYLAKNIVLERSFLNQIQCKVPEPPVDLDMHEAEQKSLRRTSKPALMKSKEPNLRDVLEKWEMTDMYSPFLITN